MLDSTMGLALFATAKHGWGRHIAGVLRVSGYALVLGAGLLAFGVHRAHAGISEGALDLGRDMAPLAEYLKEPTPLTMNGEHMVLATAMTDKSVHDVLDRFETYCRTGPGSQGQAWADLGALAANAPVDVASKAGGAFDLSVYRDERAQEGSVMCFMRSETSGPTLMESLVTFQKTHDFGSIGKMRYAYVSAGPTGRSMVLTAWTDDHFRLDSFAPPDQGDAPGSDPAGLPRPVQSRRIFGAALETAPFGAHVYRSSASPDEVRDRFDDDMAKVGWLPLGWGDDAIDPGKNRIYMKDGLQVALSTQVDEEGTLVSVGEAGAQPGEEDGATPESEAP